MTTTAEYLTRLPQRQAALVKASQRKRATAEALTAATLHAALSSKVGVRLVRQALQAHMGLDAARDGDVRRLLDECFAAEVEAKRAAEETERQAAEQRRKAAAREAAKAREAAAEQEKLRRAVEAARQRRTAEIESELAAEARRTLAEA